MTSPVEQLRAVKAKIASAEREAKREPGAVMLVA
ncbi:MAG: YggS family pyridoxal phosphate-dependent enzyme, partial [Mesorhizobium sp.]